MKPIVRQESWGTIRYNPDEDLFHVLNHSNNPHFREDLKGPLSIGWLVTGECNLACPHCYGNKEDLPQTADRETRRGIAKALADSAVMRVILSGGEPLMLKDIFDLMDLLADQEKAVTLTTNGTFVKEKDTPRLRRLARLGISLDGATPETHNRRRISRNRFGNSWDEAITAIRRCVEGGVHLKVLTSIGTDNHGEIPALSDLLAGMGVTHWNVSHIIAAGRARVNNQLLAVARDPVAQAVAVAKMEHPGMYIGYRADLQGSTLSRNYPLVLPNGDVSAEDMTGAGKVVFGTLPGNPIEEIWKPKNFDIEAHFRTFVVPKDVTSQV